MTPTAYDLVIVGGGINGCGIARDAAGRGLRVLLVEQDDIASATSSWSSKLIHGGLRYLEQYEFRLVREALKEREVLLGIAPHLIHPLEFILPHDKHMRPAWMVRIGMFLYDHLGGRISLPGSRTVMFPHAQYSAGLKPAIRRGFFYSDARVDDARLTLANAVAAREKGAEVRVRTRLVAGRRQEGAWQLTLESGGRQDTVTAAGVVNAAGPWVKDLLDDAFTVEKKERVRLVKGSHIVVPRVHPHGHAYILQNDDKRVAFVIPFEREFSLIGTTDVTVGEVGEAREISAAETHYLLRAANRWLATPVRESDIVWTYAGVRPLYDDGSDNPAEVTRDYVLKVDHADGALPILSIFGGKITTYRKLAEHALDDLARFYPAMGPAWTHGEALPGGDIDSIAVTAGEAMKKHPGLPIDYLTRLAERHGSKIDEVLHGVRGMDQLGQVFGMGANLLAEREIEWCIANEWARAPDDILWRRTKCGLHMDDAERARAAAFIASKVKVQC